MAKILFQLLLVGVTLCMTSAEEICNQPMDEGTGEELKLQYFYEHNARFCLPFYYKGQGGNANRFDSDKNCMGNCSSKYNEQYPAADAVCNLELDQGSCFARLLMYYYNQEEKNCRLFIYGGCHGNGNRFETREECQQTCMARSGRFGGSDPIPNPDQATTDAGLVVGILGGVVFTVAVIASVVLIVKQKKEKDSRGERQPVPAIEMN